jgi:glutathione S-transferase
MADAHHQERRSMKLFWTPASPFVRKVMVSAIELGLRDRIQIHPTYWPHDWGRRTIVLEPEFVAANPIARIPTLVTDEGVAIPESNWICDYLDSLGAKRRLLPQDGEARWKCVRMLAISDGALEAMIARRAETLRGLKERSEDFIAKQRDRIGRCLDRIERELDSILGEINLAQISSGVACGYMDFRYPEDGWRALRPRLSEWYERFATRPAMLQTMPAETPQRRPNANDAARPPLPAT